MEPKIETKDKEIKKGSFLNIKKYRNRIKKSETNVPKYSSKTTGQNEQALWPLRKISTTSK